MRVQLTDPVTYWLCLGEEESPLNQLIGHDVTLEFNGSIYCIQCARKTSKSFQQGYCFPCMRRILECDNCMLYPERCHVEAQTCPHNDWAHTQCFQEHYVYLANSSGLKVGITRHNHIPSRWVDQGASCALPILKVRNRRQAGLVEVILKQYVRDKTNWQVMLKNGAPEIDLQNECICLLEQAQMELKTLADRYEVGVIEVLENQSIVTITYPVLEYPVKITSLSFDKTPRITGRLRGIKGQYLLFDCGVLNVRKFGGYLIRLTTHDSQPSANQPISH